MEFVKVRGYAQILILVRQIRSVVGEQKQLVHRQMNELFLLFQSVFAIEVYSSLSKSKLCRRSIQVLRIAKLILSSCFNG